MSQEREIEHVIYRTQDLSLAGNWSLNVGLVLLIAANSMLFSNSLPMIVDSEQINNKSSLCLCKKLD